MALRSNVPSPMHRASSSPADPGGFRHEALLYEGGRAFLDTVLPFVRDGVRAGEPVLAALAPDKLSALERALGADARGVRFVDMLALGANPGRILPEWFAFVDEHRGRPVRGVGEPAWPGRTPAELEECRLHEGLLNTAFEGLSPWWLVCPYDVSALPPDVVREALTTHPFVRRGGRSERSSTYAGADPADWAPGRLGELSAPVATLRFGGDDLVGIRAATARAGEDAGLSRERREALVLAVNELVTNSMRHGGGAGTLRVWLDGDAVVCEVRDGGVLRDQLSGRRHPDPRQIGGRGLWLVHQLCDLVQVRAFPGGTVVRVRLGRAPASGTSAGDRRRASA